MGDKLSGCCCEETADAAEYWHITPGFTPRLRRFSTLDKTPLGIGGSFFEVLDDPLDTQLGFSDVPADHLFPSVNGFVVYNSIEAYPSASEGQQVLWIMGFDDGTRDHKFARLDVGDIDNIQVLSNQVTSINGINKLRYFPTARVDLDQTTDPLTYAPPEVNTVELFRAFWHPGELPASPMPFPYDPPLPDFNITGDVYRLYAVATDHLLFTSGAGILRIESDGSWQQYSNHPDSVAAGNPMVLSFARRYASRCIGLRATGAAITEVDELGPNNFNATIVLDMELVVGDSVIPDSASAPRMTVDAVLHSWEYEVTKTYADDPGVGALDLDYNLPDYPHGIGFPNEIMAARLYDFDSHHSLHAASALIRESPSSNDGVHYFGMPWLVDGLTTDIHNIIFVTQTGNVVHGVVTALRGAIVNGLTQWSNKTQSIYVNGNLVQSMDWPNGTGHEFGFIATECGNGAIFVSRPSYDHDPWNSIAPSFAPGQTLSFSLPLTGVQRSFEGLIIDPETAGYVPYYKAQQQNGGYLVTPRTDRPVNQVLNQITGYHGITGLEDDAWDGRHTGIRLFPDRLLPDKSYYFNVAQEPTPIQ